MERASISKPKIPAASSHRTLLFLAPQPLDVQTGRPAIQRLFIANRGEIACRVIATCKKLQIQTVVAYVKEDEASRHVLEATKAIDVGSMEEHATNPFLNIDLMVQVALDSNADAVHPGYGYLSESSEFATRVQKVGLIFVGPSPTTMSTLGDKRSSKAYLQRHAPDVPLIPGFAGASTRPDDLEEAAARVGYPVMLKASAGGGGKGMRIVRERSQLRDELERVQSEASRSFGSADCILERYVERSKHVEIQIVGDKHGNTMSFFERDCSIQRRHQKVVEESPCPFLTDDVRRRMGETAIRVAKLVGYENAGTVEFVMDIETSEFYFLEVNARLQVEHPITEETTGVDLVALQLYVAAGGNLESLPRLHNLQQLGHAIECRLCAEDPGNDFFPEHGKIHLWRPADGDHRDGDVRYETALQTNSTVSIYFDPMIAKIVVWAPTREEAVRKMASVLSQMACVGVRTNQLFLQRCLAHQAFQDPRYNTTFITRHLKALLSYPASENMPPQLRDAETIIPILFLRRVSHDYGVGQGNARPFTNVRTGFRNQYHDPMGVRCDVVTSGSLSTGTVVGGKNEKDDSRICFWNPELAQSTPRKVSVKITPLHQTKQTNDTDINSGKEGLSNLYYDIGNLVRSGQSELSTVDVNVLGWYPIHSDYHGRDDVATAATITVSVNRFKVIAHCVAHSQAAEEEQVVFCHFPHLGTYIKFRRNTLLSYVRGRRSQSRVLETAGRSSVRAPMPCKVLSVHKKTGDSVEVGDLVMVIESMKMEVSIRAEAKGQFETTWEKGNAVDEGKILCTIT